MKEKSKYGTASYSVKPKSNANCITRERVDEMTLDKDGQITDFEYDGLAYTLPEGYQFVDENGNVINATKIVLEKKSPKTDDIIKWLREHDMTKYIGVIYSGMCSITFDTEKLIKDIIETIGDE